MLGRVFLSQTSTKQRKKSCSRTHSDSASSEAQNSNHLIPSLTLCQLSDWHCASLNFCLHVVECIIPFNLICNLLTPSQGLWACVRAKYFLVCCCMLRFIPFNLICNIFNLKKLIFGPVSTPEVNPGYRIQASKLKFHLICFISTVSLFAFKSLVKNIDS